MWSVLAAAWLMLIRKRSHSFRWYLIYCFFIQASSVNSEQYLFAFFKPASLFIRVFKDLMTFYCQLSLSFVSHVRLFFLHRPVSVSLPQPFVLFMPRPLPSSQRSRVSPVEPHDKLRLLRTRHKELLKCMQTHTHAYALKGEGSVFSLSHRHLHTHTHRHTLGRAMWAERGVEWENEL